MKRRDEAMGQGCRQRSRIAPLTAVGAATLALLLASGLTACAAEPEANTPPVPQAAETPDAPAAVESPGEENGPEKLSGTAVLDVAGESFLFAVDFCAIDGHEILVYAPGQGEISGGEAFLSVDLVEIDDAPFVAGEARVELGTTERFTSTDEFYTFDYAISREHSLTAAETEFLLEGEFFSADGASQGIGTLAVDCG